MKLTRNKLRKIILEEARKLMVEHEQYIYRHPETNELRISDDDGNDERAPAHLQRRYRDLPPGYENGQLVDSGGGGGGAPWLRGRYDRW